MPAYSARIRSGLSAAIFSNSVSDASTSGTGESPRRGWAHSKIRPGAVPNHSVTANGTTPSASSASCSTSPTVTTRVGSAGMVALPNWCSMVTGKAPVSTGGSIGSAGAALDGTPEPSAGELEAALLGAHCWGAAVLDAALLDAGAPAEAAEEPSAGVAVGHRPPGRRSGRGRWPRSVSDGRKVGASDLLRDRQA